MYYALIVLSVVMFGGCFALNDAYREKRGNSLRISMQFTLLSSVTGLVVLLIVNGFKFEFTVFTFIIAMLSALSGVGFTFCSFKALGNINLSVYSLFSMLGGMALPFIQGIVFYRERITLAKVICFAFITVALLLTVQKGEKSKGTVYYIGIFVLNGMSGVFAKIFASASFDKTSSAGYSILISLCCIIISAVSLIFLSKDADYAKPTVLSETLCSASGIVEKLANLILVIALSHVDASVQYPMVTGGVMIVSTVICLFGKNKPSKNEIISVFVSFVGLLALFAIPV